MTRSMLPLTSSTSRVVSCEYDASRHSEESDKEFPGRKGLLKLFMMNTTFHCVDQGNSVGRDGCCRSPRSKGLPCHSIAGRGGGLIDMKTAVNQSFRQRKLPIPSVPCTLGS